MDNPHNTSRLRRKTSLPVKLQRRASTLRARLHMKSNPYVGSFRHSPPTSFRSVVCATHASGSCETKKWKVTSLPLKSSPYVGWFRHAPPSKVKVHKVDPKHIDLLAKCQLLASITGDSRKLKKNNDNGVRSLQEILSGHLPGGGRDPEGSKQVLESLRDALAASSVESSSATVKVLAKLGSWILFPLVYDSEKGRYTQQCDTEKILKLFPDHEPPKGLLSGDDSDHGSHSSSSPSSDSRDDDESTVLSDYDRCIPISPSSSSSVPSTPPFLRSSSHNGSPLDISVSDIATAYYAHQISEEMGLFEEDDDEGNQRLDYVITQMDVARMARNASRHLDVESITNLPTLTYQARRKRRSSPCAGQQPSIAEEGPASSSLSQSRDEEGWSWMVVQESKRPGDSTTHLSTVSNDVIEEEVDVCVICLEHFVQGDRLRVLPCNHSFHVGCIDRWLSGSHSYEACYTSGCPTCKKRPGDHLEASSSDDLDGSVPSWAFAQLGENLARASTSSPNS